MPFKDRISQMTHDSGDRVLNALGLERKSDPMDLVLPAVGIFGAGLVVGAALGLLFAPKSGAELRHDIRERAGDLKTKGQRYVHDGTEAVKQRFNQSNGVVEEA